MISHDFQEVHFLFNHEAVFGQNCKVKKSFREGLGRYFFDTFLLDYIEYIMSTTGKQQNDV